MKKKLEAELISIAHRILKLKNRSDVEQLYTESRQLYEKLAILRFAEQNYSGPKPTIGLKEIEQQIEEYDQSQIHEEPADGNSAQQIESPAEGVENIVKEVASQEEFESTTADVADETTPESFESPATPEGIAGDDGNAQETAAGSSEQEEDPSGDDIAADSGEAENDAIQEQENDEEAAQEESNNSHPDEEVAGDEPETAETANPEEQKKKEFEIPAFELTFEKKEDLKTEEPPARKQITFDDLLGPDYNDPIFEKIQAETPKVEFDGAADGEKDDFTRAVKSDEASVTDFPTGEYKPVAAKDTPSRTISFGLNDRIGFEKHLFGGSSEDMNRVVSQLTTFDTFQEAKDFIDDMVKPDYNNWEGKEDYSKRFMDIIEQRFS